MRRIAATLFAASVLSTGLAVSLEPAAAREPPKAPASTTAQPLDVMFVGNNWDGTADVVDAGTFRKIRRLNIVPDLEERLTAIRTNPVKLAYYLAINQAVGEGHDQYVDDLFSTHDGRLLAVSRPSLADVVGIDLESGAIRWRFPMEGYRSDHMIVSPDGERLLVSDSTANKVHELDFTTGRKLREFPSGDTPHESNYSRDGQKIFHASIGRIYTPVDRSELGLIRDLVKGNAVFQVVNNADFSFTRWNMGEELAKAGHAGMSSAVRPMAIAPDERYVYLQVSFFHGFVEFDTAYDNGPGQKPGRVLRIASLPNRVPDMPREQYLLDSAHHGLSMNDQGTKLCAAGTMSDYAAIVDRDTFRYRVIDGAARGHGYVKPYWSTTGPNDTCWVSMSGTDAVAVIDYATEREIGWIDVGDHPQRVRQGVVSGDVLARWQATPASAGG